jgi:hypothetical protein
VEVSIVMTARRLWGAALGALLCLSPIMAVAQTGTTGGAAQAEAYTSYLSSPDQSNITLRGGLDADELVGSEVVSPEGATVGSVSDLLIGANGEVRNALIDAGQFLGMGSRQVPVAIDRLRRTEAGPRIVRLEMGREELARLPAYQQTGDRWAPAP